MDPIDPEDHWLHGYAIAGVGGVAADSAARVGPLTKMNFLVGRNNHGKSTLLREAAWWTRQPVNGARDGRRETLVPVDRDTLVQMLRACGVRDSREVEDRLSTFQLMEDGRLAIWVDRTKTRNGVPAVDHNELGSKVRAELGVSNYSVNYSSASSPHVAARCVLVPAFRQMRSADPDQGRPDLASGEGLVAELSSWERPRNPGSAAYSKAKERWEKLQSFVRDVLEDEGAELEIAQATDLHVMLAQAGAMLHIDSLGDGIKQVLMIAATCIYFDDHLVLLEEPEIHLHAGLQRKLMRFLAQNTSNQYLIATHSAHVLDLPGARIFHVTHDGRSSRVAAAVRASDVQQVCLDLGYMASDLLQTNYTIWVEGPSDRIYWSRWLQLTDPELEEGVHFAVMSYGGYLIDSVHLLDEPDPATEDLVQLLRLGRQCVVVADSDKTSESDVVRPTVLRLREEAERPGSGDLIVCEWVRTVENMTPREIFRQTVLSRHPIAGKRLKTALNHGPYDDPYGGMKRGTFSKVTTAKDLVPKLTLSHIDDQLLTVLYGLASSIRTANGLPPREHGSN